MKTTTASAAIPFGKRFTLRSEILEEERTIRVRCPLGYETSEAAYPVLYMLDGDETLFHSLGGAAVHASEWEAKAPEMIIVGIGNTDRSRDMTPTPHVLADGRTAGGGGKAFLRFLEQELVPWIDEQYRTVDYRLLSGTSASGLAAVHALVSGSREFHGYLASSPTVNWDDRLLFRMLEEGGREDTVRPRSLYLFCGENDMGTLASDCRDFDELLQTRAPSGLRWAFHVYEGEGHCPYDGFRHGLAYVFDGWLPTSEVAAQGGDAVRGHLAGHEARFGARFELSPAAYCQVSENLMSSDHAPEAVDFLTAGVDAHPMSEDMAFYLALSLLQSKRREEAREALGRAVQRIPAGRRIATLLERLNGSPERS